MTDKMYSAGLLTQSYKQAAKFKRDPLCLVGLEGQEVGEAFALWLFTLRNLNPGLRLLLLFNPLDLDEATRWVKFEVQQTWPPRQKRGGGPAPPPPPGLEANFGWVQGDVS